MSGPATELFDQNLPSVPSHSRTPKKRSGKKFYQNEILHLAKFFEKKKILHLPFRIPKKKFGRGPGMKDSLHIRVNCRSEKSSVVRVPE